jgi:FGGY-family pentulose kinase
MSTSSPLFLGIDVGTQSLRAALFDGHGTCRAFATSPLNTTHPQPGWAEQDAHEWWAGACASIPKALASAGAARDEIAGIGLDSTACTVLPCRADSVPLGPALLWMDQRAFKEAAEISASGDAVLRYVSGTVSPEWMLPKALWLKRHRPAIYEPCERLIECTDWFMYRLTGTWTLSLNNVTVKWNYAKPDGGWSETLFRKVGLESLPSKWPREVVPLGKGEGRLSQAAARELGLRPGTPVSQGGIDAYLGMLGMGAVGPGDLAIVMGSSTCHMAMSSAGVFGSGMLGCFPDAVVDGLYTLEGGQTATGSIVNWYRQHFAGNESSEAEKSGRNVYEVLDAKAAAVAPGADGLICLDYWQGNRCPLKDPRARGTLWGLTLSHGPGHVLRSIYEATAFGTRHILEDLQTHGFLVGRLFAGGGGAKSRLWLQIHAAVLGSPIYLPRESEACALGSGLVAAVHSGHFPDLESAARQMVQIADVIEPNTDNRAAYDYYYAKYRATYPALKQLMHDLAERK